MRSSLVRLKKPNPFVFRSLWHKALRKSLILGKDMPSKRKEVRSHATKEKQPIRKEKGSTYF